MKTSNKQQRQQQWNAGGSPGNGRGACSGQMFLCMESFVWARALAVALDGSIYCWRNLLLSRGRILFSHSVLSILLKMFPLPFWIPIDTCALKVVGGVVFAWWVRDHGGFFLWNAAVTALLICFMQILPFCLSIRSPVELSNSGPLKLG